MTDIKTIRAIAEYEFEVTKKQAHVLNEKDYIKMNTMISFEKLFWLIEEAEKVERHEKTIDELEESLHVARSSRRDLLAYTKQLKEDHETLQKRFLELDDQFDKHLEECEK